MAAPGTATGWIDENGLWRPDKQNHPDSMTQEEYDYWLRNYQNGCFDREKYRNLAYTLWFYEQRRQGNVAATQEYVSRT